MILETAPEANAMPRTTP